MRTKLNLIKNIMEKEVAAHSKAVFFWGNLFGLVILSYACILFSLNYIYFIYPKVWGTLEELWLFLFVIMTSLHFILAYCVYQKYQNHRAYRIKYSSDYFLIHAIETLKGKINSGSILGLNKLSEDLEHLKIDFDELIYDYLHMENSIYKNTR